MRGITAKDLTEQTRVVSAVKLRTWCAVCDLEQDGVVLLQHAAHGFLYVCPECRAAACIGDEIDVKEKDEEAEGAAGRQVTRKGFPGRPGKRRPATMHPPRPANLAVYQPRRGRPPKPADSPPSTRVRTVLYLEADDLAWFGKAALKESGKQNRRNDLIERVLRHYRREVEQAMGKEKN